MYQPRKGIGFVSAVMLGVGSMVGAGIFGLLGQAAATAGSATWLSFGISGAIALTSGYSLAKLGCRYPSAGGLVEYLTQAWGNGLFSGSLAVLLYLSGIVGMSLVARAFGSYGSAWLPREWRALATPILAAAVVFVLMLVNLEGARGTARLENLIVGLKFLVLVSFGVVGLSLSKPELLSPETWPAPGGILSTVGLTYFAFAGFSVITNTAEDMVDPQRLLPRAMLTAIVVVLLIYLLVSLAVLGVLPAERVAESKDFALAEAALPVFGASGFAVVTVAALVSTASSLNANLYAVTNIGYQMAKDGELPQAFGTPIAHSREGLLFSSVLVAVLASTLELGSIASIGTVVSLLVQSAVHTGHLRLRRETGAATTLILIALGSTLGAVGLTLWQQGQSSPHTLGILAVVLASAVVVEVAMRKAGRRLGVRTE